MSITKNILVRWTCPHMSGQLKPSKKISITKSQPERLPHTRRRPVPSMASPFFPGQDHPLPLPTPPSLSSSAGEELRRAIPTKVPIRSHDDDLRSMIEARRTPPTTASTSESTEARSMDPSSSIPVSLGVSSRRPPPFPHSGASPGPLHSSACPCPPPSPALFAFVSPCWEYGDLLTMSRERQSGTRTAVALGKADSRQGRGRELESSPRWPAHWLAAGLASDRQGCGSGAKQ
jgi:hypothetical protein